MNINSDIESTIRNLVNRYQLGYVFSSADFYEAVKSPVRVCQILNAMVRDGELIKVAKGKFCRPETSFLGLQLPVDMNQRLKNYLVRDGRPIGYLSGARAYAALGLTTQISSAYVIGTGTYRHPITIDGVAVRFVVQPNPITKDNIPILQLLDSIRFMRKIPACTPDEACRVIKAIVSAYTPQQQAQLATLAMRYTDYVRAIVGAILDEVSSQDISALYASLNPISVYKVGLDESDLAMANKWRIRK